MAAIHKLGFRFTRDNTVDKLYRILGIEFTQLFPVETFARLCTRTAQAEEGGNYGACDRKASLSDRDEGGHYILRSF